MRIIKIILITLTLVVVAAFGIRALIHHIYWSGVRNRTLPDLLSLAAAVEHFREVNGRLPSQDEFGGLHPAPGFKVPFANEKPETWTSFERPNQRASEITDALKRPFLYEPGNGTFLIRSLGPDGIKSDDDITWEPTVN